LLRHHKQLRDETVGENMRNTIGVADRAQQLPRGEGWKDVPMYDASCVGRVIDMHGIRIVEHISQSSPDRGPPSITHTFMSDAPLDRMAAIIRQLGYSIIWFESDNRRNAAGWCIAWGLQLGRDILEPRGWDLNNFQASWNQLIPHEEFDRRIRASHLANTPAIQAYMSSHQPNPRQPLFTNSSEPPVR